MEDYDHKNEIAKAPSIFTNMFSLLNPSNSSTERAGSLALPCVKGLTPLAVDDLKISSRRRKVNTACPHIERKHYAKNMCNYCYHKDGRSGNAWLCPHTDRLLYAKGKCHFCYLQKYKHAAASKRERSRGPNNNHN